MLPAAAKPTFAGEGVDALHGQRRDRFLTSPAAGADFAFTLPGGYLYRLIMLSWTVTTSAQAGTRRMGVVIRDGDGNARFVIRSQATITVAGVETVSVAPTVATMTVATGFSTVLTFPDVHLDAGWSIGSLTEAIQTEDQIAAVRIFLEELADTYPGHAPGKQSHPHVELELEVAHAP